MYYILLPIHYIEQTNYINIIVFGLYNKIVFIHVLIIFVTEEIV